MTSQTLLHSLFRYKASANRELFASLAALEVEVQTPEYRAALRVLNHAYIVDCIFVANLQKRVHCYSASWAAKAPALGELSNAVREIDQWYLDYIPQLTSDALEEVLTFAFTDGAPGRMSREEMLAHVVTHGGYHRGEVGRLLPDIEETAMRDVFAGYLHRSDPARRI